MRIFHKNPDFERNAPEKKLKTPAENPRRTLMKENTEKIRLKMLRKASPDAFSCRMTGKKRKSESRMFPLRKMMKDSKNARVSTHAFEKVALVEVLTEHEPQMENIEFFNQLKLF